MKNIFKHIIIVYLAFFMLLASVAIPYSAMTCKISKTKSYTFLNGKFSCDKNEAISSCKETCEYNSIEKSACCLYDNGIIEADAELVISQTISFKSHLVYIALPKIPLDRFLESSLTPTVYFTIDSADPPVRILHQAFLC